jgi:hypothetical protein
MRWQWGLPVSPVKIKNIFMARLGLKYFWAIKKEKDLIVS